MDGQRKEIIIDLDTKKEQMNESFLLQMGTAIELLLKRMFGLNNLDFKIRGPKSSVNKFALAVAGEKAYMDALRKHGLNDPAVLNSRWRLQRAVTNFEKDTGIRWPFK